MNTHSLLSEVASRRPRERSQTALWQKVSGSFWTTCPVRATVSTRKVLRNPVVVGRRHDEVPVGEDLGRVGIVARRSVEHHLFVGDADDRYAAARSRGQYVTAVVDGFDLAREPHERRSVGHVCGACGPPLPKGLSGIGVDDENASLCLFGQQQRCSHS